MRDYTIRIRLLRDNIYTIRGLSEPEQIDVRDRRRACPPVHGRRTRRP